MALKFWVPRIQRQYMLPRDAAAVLRIQSVVLDENRNV